MIQRVYRATLLLGLGIVIGLPRTIAGAAPTTAGGEQDQAQTQTQPAHNREIFVTTLSRGDQRTIAVAKISDFGTVVGLAPPVGDVLRWLPGASEPQNLGGGQTFMYLNRVPLISADGSVIAVTRLIDDEATQTTNGVPSIRTRWSNDWQPLRRMVLPNSQVVGMSRNGERMAGYGFPDQTSPARPWVWSERTGQRVLPVSPDMMGAEAWAVGNDGRVVVGHQYQRTDVPNSGPLYYATRWTRDEMQMLTDRLGTPLGQAFTCSRNCAVVIGGGQGGVPDANHPNWGQAWYWTERSGAVYLGTLPDAAPGTTSYATDISADGSTIIGTYYTADPDGALHYRGFIWTEQMGMVSILSLLQEEGIEQGSDWQTLVPTAITSRGDKILIAGLQADSTTGGFVIHMPRRPHWPWPWPFDGDTTDESPTPDDGGTTDEPGSTPTR